MNEKGRSENLRLSSRLDLQRKQRRMVSRKGRTEVAKRISKQRCFLTSSALLAVILLKQTHDSLRLSEVAPGAL
jgi:hypothetical protein